MANQEDLEILRHPRHWNAARSDRPDLRDADLSGRVLSGCDFDYADLRGANLSGTLLENCRFCAADLSGADMSNAYGLRSLFLGATLRSANMSESVFSGATFLEADLRGVNLRRSRLGIAQIVGTDLREAVLDNSNVFGLALWASDLEGASQRDLIITPDDEPEVTADDLELAQFLYLLLNNGNIRKVIDTITSKVVLILGRFTPERKIVLDAIRDQLRKQNYLPVLFDFEKPSNRDITETVSTLAHMARFVIADITDARSIPQELMRIVPALPSVPVQPLILASQGEYGMFEHFKRFPWVLPLFEYEDQVQAIASLDSHVVGPAEAMAKRHAGP